MTPLFRRLNGIHDICLYVALLLGFLAVITGQTTPLWLLLGFPVGMVGAHFFHRADLASPSHDRWWNILIIVVAIALFAQYLTNPLIDIMALGVRFVLVLTLIKLFSRQGPRDELQIYALSFLTMGAASTLYEDFLYGILFGLYVLSGTFGLALFHLKTEAQRHRRGAPVRGSPFDRFYVFILAGISLLIVLSSLLIFFGFPRIGLGLFADSSRDSISIAGFSEEVEVGDHGSIRDDPSVVMRVEFDDERPNDYASYRWRTMTFDHYNGRSWSRQLRDTDRSVSYSMARRYNLDFLYRPYLREHFNDDEATVVEVFLEPLGSNVLPTLWPTSQIQLGDADSSPFVGSSTPSLRTDDYGDLRHTLDGNAGINYELTVQPRPEIAELRRQSGRQLNPDDATRYLQLPDMDPRVVELAESLTGEANAPYEKAEAIAEHFNAEFAYSLDLPQIEGDDPVAEFLFDHRYGHCEYFATSAAMLLRSAGVPTRLVNGFLGGTWNDVGDYLTVRQGDAHAWVEIFVPELGWVPFEPTPPIESTFLERAGISQFVSDSVDTMRHTWTVWFLEYDLQRQIGLFREIGQALAPEGLDVDDTSESEASDDTEEPRMPIRPFIFWGGWLALVLGTYMRGRTHPRIDSAHYAVGLAIGVCLAAAWAGWFQGWMVSWTAPAALSVFLAGALPAALRHGQTSSGVRLATRLFKAIEHRATASDLARHPHEGPGAFLSRIGDKIPSAAADAATFRSLYLGVRFGGQELSAQQEKNLQRSAKAIISALRRS